MKILSRLLAMDDCDPASATLLAESTSGSGQAESINVTGLAAGTYYIFVDGFGGASDDYTLFVSCPQASNTVEVRPKIFLQGAYNGADMNHTLDAMMPTTEPYTAIGYNFVGGGGETTTASIISSQNIVDWVLVELRSKNNSATVLASCAALLKSNGDVIRHTDGISAVEFDVPADDYFVAVRHRNHLGVMTSSAVRLD